MDDSVKLKNMEQIVIDIPSVKDAELIKELLKKFKGVEVNSFSTNMNPNEIQRRIEQGLKEADEGKLKPWKQVKAEVLKNIRTKAKKRA